MASFKLTSFILAFVFVAFASVAFAGDTFIKIGGIKGESDRIVRCPDGTCVVEDIPPGSFSLTVCDAKGNPLTTDLKVTAQFNPKEYTVTKSSEVRESPKRDSGIGTVTGTGGATIDIMRSPRDAASGLPTGKRQHKPITITKEWGASTPKLMMKTPTGEEYNTVVRWTLEVRVDRIEMK